jgi:hypothetical protein
MKFIENAADTAQCFVDQGQHSPGGTSENADSDAPNRPFCLKLTRESTYLHWASAAETLSHFLATFCLTWGVTSA